MPFMPWIAILLHNSTSIFLATLTLKRYKSRLKYHSHIGCGVEVRAAGKIRFVVLQKTPQTILLFRPE